MRFIFTQKTHVYTVNIKGIQLKKLSFRQNCVKTVIVRTDNIFREQFDFYIYFKTVLQ